MQGYNKNFVSIAMIYIKKVHTEQARTLFDLYGCLQLNYHSYNKVSVLS